MESSQETYIRQVLGQRSLAMAQMILTRRENVLVSEEERHTDLDLLVHLLDEGTRTGRLFGVAVKGYRSLPEGATWRSPQTSSERDQLWIPATELKDERLAFSELPFPVCLLLFTMDEDRGYARWLVKPNHERNGSSPLTPVSDNVFTPVTDASLKDNGALDTFIRDVHRWYDDRHRR